MEMGEKIEMDLVKKGKQYEVQYRVISCPVMSCHISHWINNILNSHLQHTKVNKILKKNKDLRIENEVQ